MALGRYSAHDNSRSLIIKRFNGQYWDTVGAPYDFISAGTTFEFGDITMDSARIPYVVYSGAVKKFVGGAWIFEGAGPGEFERPVIEVDRFATPCVM